MNDPVKERLWIGHDPASTVDLDEQITRPRGAFICNECDRVNLRNVVVTKDGKKHHFGCLKRGFSRYSFHCNACGKDLKRGQAAKTYVMGVPARSCGLCGAVGTVISIRAYAGSWGVAHPGGL